MVLLFKMIITLNEIIDIIIMTLALGFIFSGLFQRRRFMRRGFDFEGFKFATMVTAPAVVFHELGHKFIALIFGINAVFHAAYFWLLMGVMLKLANFPFIFFIPGYVSYPVGAGTHLQNALIALAGPLTNLIIFIIASLLLKKAKNKKQFLLIYLTKQINLFLFIFNMIPILPFDGGHFFYNIVKAVF